MNKSDIKRDYWMLDGRFARKGYDWWWHNFTAVNEVTGQERAFLDGFFYCAVSCAFYQRQTQGEKNCHDKSQIYRHIS